MATQASVIGQFFPSGKTEADVEADLDVALAEIARLQTRIKENQDRTARAANETRIALTHLETLLPDPIRNFAKQ